MDVIRSSGTPLARLVLLMLCLSIVGSFLAAWTTTAAIDDQSTQNVLQSPSRTTQDELKPPSNDEEPQEEEPPEEEPQEEEPPEA